MPGRTIAIGDIHGCSAALAALIDAIAPRPDDLIVPLGDFVDRGPDSAGTIQMLIELSERCQLVPILGNHDQAMLDVRDRKVKASAWIGMGGLATLASYGAAWGELDKVPEAHFRFLESCRPFHETETHLFVHAQYLADRPLSEQPPEVLRWASLRDGAPRPHISGKQAVVGHTAQKRGEVLDHGHLICIDTFCYGGKWLTAFDVASRRLWQSTPEGRLRNGPTTLDPRPT